MIVRKTLACLALLAVLAGCGGTTQQTAQQPRPTSTLTAANIPACVAPPAASGTVDRGLPDVTLDCLVTGQAVKLKLDAFPYAEYGVVAGELVRVPPDAEGADSANGSFYRAVVRLQEQSVNKDGTAFPLASGMTGTAEVVTERKTILQILLSPFLGLAP